jgi:hypothetical protein
MACLTPTRLDRLAGAAKARLLPQHSSTRPLLQEHIMQGSFGGETFTFSLFLVLCNRLTTMTVALSMLLVRRRRRPCWRAACQLTVISKG